MKITQTSEATLHPNLYDNDPCRVAILYLIASGMLPDEIAHMLLLSPERTDEIIHPLCVELGVSNHLELLVLIYSLQELRALPEELAPERGSESPIGTAVRAYTDHEGDL